MQAPSRARALDADVQPGRLGFLTLIGILAGSAAILHRIAGLPHLPARIPSLLEVVVTLRGSDVPLGALGYIFTTAAWLVWLWIAGTLMLQLMLLAAERVSNGAAGVRAARRALNAFTLPVVRRTAEALFGGMLLVSVAAQSAPIAAAASATAPIAAISNRAVSMQATNSTESAVDIHYIVQPGDSLWLISQRFYAIGSEYPRLVEANVGRQMADGQFFTPEGVLQPGWVLRVPLPSTAVEEVGGKTLYTVEAGDSLSGIAARLLGNESRWSEIFQLNTGKRSGEGQAALSDPNVIWPGLRLELPNGAAPAAQQPVPPPARVTPTSARPKPTVAVPAASAAAAASVPASTVPHSAPSPALPRTFTPAIQPRPGVLAGPPAAYAGGAAAAAVATAGMILARRRFRRSLNELPAPDEVDVPLQEGFAEADTGRTFGRRMAGADVEPVQLLAEYVQRFLDEAGCSQARVLAARQGRNSAAMTIACSLADQARIIELAADFGRRLGAQAQAVANADHDVIWQLSGLKLMNLPITTESASATAPCLIPVGLLPSKQVLHGNWHALGSVLVAGLAGGGADLVMSSLLSALAARRRPEQLQLWTVGTDRGLPAGLLRFPQQAQACIDPADEPSLSAVAERLNEALNERIDAAARGDSTAQAEIVVVIEELSDISCIWDRLEPVAAQGPAYGIRLLAAAEAPHLLSPDMVVHFGTRLVLQTLDGDQGMLVVGQPDAAELRAGELLVRLDGRRPIRVRGFRLRLEYLGELGAMMIDAYGTGSLAGEPAAADVASEREPAADEGTPSSSEPDAADPPSADQPELADEASGASSEPELEVIEEPDRAEAAPAKGRRTAMQTMLPIGVTAERADSVAQCLEQQPNPERDSASRADRRPVSAVELLRDPGHKQPVQVECFGSLRVLYGHRDLLAEDGGAHHKAWELMAFLSARPNGVVSREKLLDALWPDLELDRAENALRQIRFRLKNFLAQHVPELKGEIVRSERDGTCRLNPELAGSDVQRFWELTRAMPRLNAEDAVGAYDELSLLYRSDLLIDPCFEWVHNRESGGLSLQERFREEFRRMTKHVARLNQEAGHPERAVPLYRRLLLAEPTLEDVARELYRCYTQLGDRSALIREHRHLRQAIQQMFADPDDPEDSEIYDPEAETIAAYEEALAAIDKADARSAETA